MNATKMEPIKMCDHMGFEIGVGGGGGGGCVEFLMLFIWIVEEESRE